METENIEGFRLSHQQRRLWALQQDAHPSPYQARCAILLEGNLKAEVLKAALESVVRRHEILRTVFPCLSGTALPVQVITDGGPVWEDMCGGGVRESHEDALFQAMDPKAFDLAQDPVVQASLVRLSGTRHMLHLVLPALCADAHTLGNLVGEIGRAYSAGGRCEAPEDDLLQYVDFSEWQNELLESDEREQEKEYWRQQSELPDLSLPFARRPEPGQAFVPQRCPVAIPHDVLGRLEQVAGRYETSVFLLACWQVLLWRLTDRSDPVVGLHCDGRPYEELKEAVGLFAGYRPLHAHLEPGMPFDRFLRQVEKATQSAYEAQAYFTWEFMTVQNGSGLPYFPFGFDYEEVTPRYVADDLSLLLYKQETCIERFQIQLACRKQEDRLHIDLCYDANQFNENIGWLAAHFRTLLSSTLDRPDVALDAVEMLGETERRQVLVAWNDTRTDYPHDRCVHELFEARVALAPDAAAVVYEGDHLSYEELNRRSNRLAHYLRSLGVGPKTRVGICLERSLELMVGLLGILKAGGAYVPLDPNYPGHRLKTLVDDAGARVLLTQQDLLDRLPQGEIRLVCLDGDRDDIAQYPADTPAPLAIAENLAYVIYTSGSTGSPKGVEVTHQGLCNYLCWCTQAYFKSRGDGAPLYSSIGFDLTVTSLLAPLVAGEPVVLLPEAGGLEALSKSLGEKDSFSLVKLTPSHLQALAECEMRRQVGVMVVGGEALIGEDLAFLPDGIEVVNEYGPTEAVVGCCVHTFLKTAECKGPVPIGRPIANARMYLLDAHLAPVGVGIVGEIYIGGLCLARGYLDRPDQTAELFLPDPFSGAAGARMYRTGDLGRYRPDGVLEFLGRIDDQVKVRGYRIELGEIEAVLSQHSEVRQSVVVMREYAPGDKRLVAYLVAQPSAVDRSRHPLPNGVTTPPALEAGELNSDELRSFLSERLPYYMVPSTFVLLDALSLTPSGKVDRKALPAPEVTQFARSETYVAPQTEEEEELASIWAEVLRVERIGTQDDFFALGGHSLLAMRVASRIRQVFQIELPLASLFEATTVEELAAEILQRQLEEADEETLTRMLDQIEQDTEEDA